MRYPVIFLFACFYFPLHSIAQKSGLQTHSMVRFNNWILDLDQLALVSSMPDGQVNLVWDVNKEITGKMDDVNKEGAEIQTREGKKIRLQVNDKVENNVNINYVISATDVGSGKQLWKYTPPYRHSTSGSLRYARSGDSLFLLVYSPIATGSNVHCVNIDTGKEIWTGDVAQLMVGHSQYLNTVRMRKIGDHIVLAGSEAGGSYLQVLDARTGKNLFKKLQKTW